MPSRRFHWRRQPSHPCAPRPRPRPAATFPHCGPGRMSADAKKCQRPFSRGSWRPGFWVHADAPERQEVGQIRESSSERGGIMIAPRIERLAFCILFLAVACEDVTDAETAIQDVGANAAAPEDGTLRGE